MPRLFNLDLVRPLTINAIDKANAISLNPLTVLYIHKGRTNVKVSESWVVDTSWVYLTTGDRFEVVGHRGDLISKWDDAMRDT